ncbi:MAG: DUF4097 family beta strand repeat-containing protein [bacterium]|nr:DUF4097 family beta strand repeat-containing protein [bacterium]
MSGRRGWVIAAVVIMAIWLVCHMGHRVLVGATRLIGPRLFSWPLDMGLVRSDISSDVSTHGHDVLEVEFATGNVHVFPSVDERRLAVARADIAASNKPAHDSVIPRFTSSTGEGVLRLSGNSMVPPVVFGALRVTYEIWAPPDLELRVTTRNGSVSVSGWEAPVTIHTSNGSINLILDNTPAVAAGTSNGSIVADLGLLEDGEYRLTTGNGSIRVSLSPASSVALDARTSNGSVLLKMPGWVLGELHTARAIEASLGGGTALLVLRTSNGSITVEAAD